MKEHFQQRVDDTRQAYLDALKRLKEGKATHVQLKDKKVKINASSIALEAGKSRNPLYHTHKDILSMVNETKSENKKNSINNKEYLEVDLLRNKVKELEEMNKKLMNVNATLLFNQK